jgi:hypothetical protein
MLTKILKEKKYTSLETLIALDRLQVEYQNCPFLDVNNLKQAIKNYDGERKFLGFKW